jgi:exopolysaccharide production protein ExoQ
MPTVIATLICIFFIIFLFLMDRKKTEGVSCAIWIPFIWMFLAGSRYVSQWLNLGTPDINMDAILDGSPFDRSIFTTLVIAGIMILWQRRINWKEVFTQNAWILLFLMFGAISICWSDYPFVSFKRWIKAIGSVVMVLVILTEESPYTAIGVILRRLAFLLLPLSILFIKYYPDLGRAYFMGMPLYTGVSLQKNGLGQICLLTGIYFSWDLLFNRNERIEPRLQLHYSVYLLILPMIVWLFFMANSATSLACMVLAAFFFVIGRLHVVARAPHRILYLGIACIVLFGALELSFDVKKTLISMLDRRPDLTDRVPMWEGLLDMAKNPLVGYGWESFWLGERGQKTIERWGLSNAHNGYLEMYLNLGLIGLFFLLCLIFFGIRKVSHYLNIDYQSAILRLCFIMTAVVYNWTEATFVGVNNMWMLLLLGIISIPTKHKSIDLSSLRE